VFGSIVKMPSVTLPVAGTLASFTPLLGIQGVIGVKSGYTSEANGCDIVAVVRKAHNLPVLVLAAVTGETGPNVLTLAGLEALAVANAAAMGINATPVVRAGQHVAEVTAAGHTVSASVSSTLNLLTWPGSSAQRTFIPVRHISTSATRGDIIGTEVLSLGSQRYVLPVRLDANVPQESFLQRLF
jgi:D-alanyl-D-alanine carboxypeptidase